MRPHWFLTLSVCQLVNAMRAIVRADTLLGVLKTEVHAFLACARPS
jgi:hypothetical protein